MEGEAFEAAFKVIRALKRLKVDHHIGGSLASSIHGFPRATLDADLVADLRQGQGRPFRDLLGQGFYAEAAAIEDAIRRKRCFNVIFLKTMFKVDVFVLGDGRFYQESFRRSVPLPIGKGGALVPVATPEDTVLHKLLWFRKGGEVSGRQWSDLQGVLKVQGEKLDLAYMRRWAREMRLLKLLNLAFKEAGPPGRGA